MTNTQAQKISEFFTQAYDNWRIGFDPMDYLTVQELEEKFNSFDEIKEYLFEENIFTKESEIIYYAKAMEYLAENDPSLQYSLGIAHELGFEVDKLNSELLASLLKERNLIDTFDTLEQETDDILSTNK